MTTTNHAPNCPRCHHRLYPTDEGAKCYPCGFVDYDNGPKVTNKQTIFNSSTMFVLRYVGRHPDLSEMVVRVRAILSPSLISLWYIPTCPWCGQDMQPPGHYKDRSESRYQCQERHQLLIDTDVPEAVSSLGLGWS